MMINEIQFKSIFGTAPGSGIIDAINQTLARYDITVKQSVASFLSQCGHESAHFTKFSENLNYSGDRLQVVFPKYFKSISIDSYSRNPKAIASRVYANRMGNGNEASGDGFKYKGRGCIQITGKENYKNLSDDLDIDFISKPELLETLPNSILCAGWYWKEKGLYKYSTKGDVKGLTLAINGGLNGLEERGAIYLKAMGVL